MKGRNPAPRAVTAAFSVAAGLSVACAEPEVIGFGEYGRPIDLIADGSALPRLASQSLIESCDAPAGPCPSICLETEPGNCPPDACLPALIDSGSPFTVLPGDGYALGRGCVGVRQGYGVVDDVIDFASSVTRFRFSQVPLLTAPSTKAGPWEWDAGSGPSIEGEQARRIDVGAVIGGNLLRHFAVRLTHQNNQRSVTFYEQFPGTQKGLADLGFAFLRLQFPGRLLGTRVNDRCAFGEGVACDLDQLQLSAFQGDLNFEETRMMVDACVAPPPCAPLWEVEDSTGRRDCELRPGRAATLADAGRRCVDADDPEGGGRGASFVVATGVDNLVLFEDSAIRMFGPPAELPPCSGGDPLPSSQRACLEDENAELHVTGYGRVDGLRRVRIRSLAVVAGDTQPSAPGPCTRLRRRLTAAELSCRGLDDLDRPHAPNISTELRRDEAVLIKGETMWGFGQTTPNPSTWLLTTILPADSTIAMNIRREAGTNAVQPDGLLGTTLLDNTDVVLDYTERDDSIGIRAACTQRNVSTCMALPACSPSNPRAGESEPGRESCCWGMPANLVEDALTRPGNGAEACCPTLTAAALERVQRFGACRDVIPPQGIGGITP